MKNKDNTNKTILAYVNGIIDTLREPFLVLDSQLCIITSNRSFYKVFQVLEKDTLGKKLPDLGNGQWNIPNLIFLIREVLPQKKIIKDYEVEHAFNEIGHRVMHLNASKLRVSEEVVAMITSGQEKNPEEGRVEEKELILLAIEDITVRRKTEKLLEEISNRKSEYVTNVSHEFRNPLSVITESMSMMEDGLAGKVSSRQNKIINMVKRNADRLLSMISNILNLSAIESGKIKMNCEEIEIVSLVDYILGNYKIKAAEKKLIIEKKIAGNINRIWGDKDKIEQVLVNLLTNAIKYTPVGGKIEINLLKTKDKIRFEIFNTGAGVTEKEINKLFDKYERLTAEKEEGTGLGLTIAKEIIELHKGKIWAESDPGTGSRFIFIIPKDYRNIN